MANPSCTQHRPKGTSLGTPRETGAGDWFMVGSWCSGSYPEQGQRAWMRLTCMRKRVNLVITDSPNTHPRVQVLLAAVDPRAVGPTLLSQTQSRQREL